MKIFLASLRQVYFVLPGQPPVQLKAKQFYTKENNNIVSLFTLSWSGPTSLLKEQTIRLVLLNASKALLQYKYPHKVHVTQVFN